LIIQRYLHHIYSVLEQYLLQAKVVKTGQLSALKIIKIEAGEDFNIIQQEIAILADCKHENIVGYFGSYLRY